MIRNVLSNPIVKAVLVVIAGAGADELQLLGGAHPSNFVTMAAGFAALLVHNVLSTYAPPTTIVTVKGAQQEILTPTALHAALTKES